MKKENPREIAVQILILITEKGGYNNLVLKKILTEKKDLSQVDKAFITEIVNGTLRNIILIDFIINAFSKTATTKMKPFILNVLRASVYQIKCLDKTPTFAICNEAVNMTKTKGFVNLSGFVNGILRNIARNIEHIESLDQFPRREKNLSAYLSLLYSYPKWLMDYWLSFLDPEVVEDMCIANGKAPVISICVNTLKIGKDSLKKKLLAEGIVTEDSERIHHALKIKGNFNLTNSKLFNEGFFHVMDHSAMLAVEILTPKKTDIVYDLCAAPGGKSFFSAYLMENEGDIYAGDIYEHKLTLINEGADRLGIEIIHTEIQDAAKNNSKMNGLADCVLVDAPCSGFGLVKKKPDIKYTKSKEDVASLVKIQREILAAASEYVKIGGGLVYSTCTVSELENRKNVEWFIENFSYELESVTELIPSNEYEHDGFFIARMIRTV